MVLNGLMEKWKTSTYDLEDLRGLEYLAPMEKEREQVAILDRRELQP